MWEEKWLLRFISNVKAIDTPDQKVKRKKEKKMRGERGPELVAVLDS
jgi:hypothetical protein